MVEGFFLSRFNLYGIVLYAGEHLQANHFLLEMGHNIFEVT